MPIRMGKIKKLKIQSQFYTQFEYKTGKLVGNF